MRAGAERYPQNVEALVLDSTETPTGPEAFHVSTFKAMTPALRELCSHGACDGVTSNPVAQPPTKAMRFKRGADFSAAERSRVSFGLSGVFLMQR